MDQIIDRVMNSTEIGTILDNKSREEIRAKIANYIGRFHQPGKAMPMNLSNTAWLTCVHCTKRQILATLAVKLRFVPCLLRLVY